ncbi:uncharacterized protein [Onthophagus taurus]|uniref:uncharacterized protein n=1 Tax=Onthophagus taurus TaxID=166361 RepID=UPI000C205494|nr:uncharacterized protein LOC111425182 [Onthophagus taurus]
MRSAFVFLISTYLMEQYNAQIHCKDIHQHIVSQGLHYIPGTNPCTLCVCDKGSPKWCKSVLCAPPQNCKSFQMGTLCCEFKCLDDLLTAHDDTYDVALRFIASAVTAILSLSLLFFLFHRLKRRKGNTHPTQQLNDDQRSLNSIGYIAGSLGYLPDGIGYLGSGSNDIEYHYEESSPQYCLWKPPSNYFPQGEAPPPYEEAVRSAQLENDINSQLRLANAFSMPSRSPVPARVESSTQATNTCRHVCDTSDRRQYANLITEDVTVHENRKSDENRNKITKSHNREKNIYENIPLSTKPSVVPKRDRATSSDANRNARGQKPIVETTQEYLNLDKPIVKIGRYDVIVENTRRIAKPTNQQEPSSSKTAENINQDGNYTVFNVPERFNAMKSRNGECPPTQSLSNSKSLNRELSKLKAERSEHNLRSLIKLDKDVPSHRTLPKNLRELLANAECFTAISNANKDDSSAKKYQPVRLQNFENPSTSRTATVVEATNSLENLDIIHPAPPNFASPVHDTKRKKDDELSLISYRCLSSSPDDEDYRSECENCKSAGFTIPDDEEADVLNETMTLQRRPLETTGEDVSYYRTSLTLPTNTKNPRKTRITNSNRENWFTSMRETSSSEEAD